MENSERHFICNYPNCQSAFGTRYNLRRHIEARHLGIKKFSCDICGLKLASRQTKEEHQYTHTGERPYMCSFPGCFKEFRQSSQLSVHMKLHSFAQIELTCTLPPISESRRIEQASIKLPLPPSLR